MKKIALLFMSFVIFCISNPLYPEYYGVPRVYVDKHDRTWYFIDSSYRGSVTCSLGTEYDRFPKDLSDLDGAYYWQDPYCYNTRTDKDIFCTSSIVGTSYRYDSYNLCYSQTPPSPENDETCSDSPYENSYSFPEDDICLDCSNKVGFDIPKCLCEGLGDSYLSKRVESTKIIDVDGKCYVQTSFSCDSDPEARSSYYESIVCPENNETNITGPIIPGDNITNPNDNTTNPNDNSTGPGGNPNDNTTNPDNNSTNPNGNTTGNPDGSPGGNPNGNISGTPGGDPWGIPEGNPIGNVTGNITGNITNDNETNGTCWWCSDEKSVDSKGAFDALSNEINVLYSSYFSAVSLLTNGFSLNIPDRKYNAPSIDYHGKTISFDVCSSFSIFAPIIEFIITICGILITLKIYFWSV